MSIAGWKQPSSFRVRVSNVKAVGVDAKDKSGTSDPYVVFEFDTMKKFQSSKLEKTLNPVWKNFAIDFVYDTNYPERLQKKFLLLEVWDNDVMDKDDKIGSSSLDLFSCCTGATHYELQLEAPDDGHNAGILMFDMVFEEVTQVLISLAHFRVVNFKFTYEEDDENFKPSPYFKYNTLKDSETTYDSEVQEETYQPFTEKLPPVSQAYSLREFMEDGITMRMRHKKVGRHPIIGTFDIMFKKNIQGPPEEGKWYAVQEPVVDDDGKSCGVCEGFFGFSGLSKIAQMVGAEYKFNATTGGRKLFPYLPPPRK